MENICHHPVPVASLSNRAVKRKVGDEHRQFQENWEMEFFLSSTGALLRVSYAQINLQCIRNTTSDVITQLNMLRSIQNTREMREITGSPILKKCLLRQQDLFKKASKENEAAVEASYVVSEMIARARKPFKEGEFIKKCMLLAASKVCLEKVKFSNISL